MSSTTSTIMSSHYQKQQHQQQQQQPSKRTRATGEVLEFLISEFEKCSNPSPEYRKFISDKAQMTEKAVRIWFQNRRAKQRKFEKSQKDEPGTINQNLNVRAGSDFNSFDNDNNNNFDHDNFISLPPSINTTPIIPIELNEKYCFINCSSLSVGSWQRIKSGYHDEHALLSHLINLSPFTLNNVMTSVDLLVLLSKKNYELNYFFSAVSNDSKILFRIFYPLSSIINNTIHSSNLVEDNHELRINLCHQPKFSVYFFNGINSSTNQWSICDDFSEGQQVSQAFDMHGDGSNCTPHVLVGCKSSLEYLNSFILNNNPNIINQPPLPSSAIPLQMTPGAPSNLNFNQSIDLLMNQLPYSSNINNHNTNSTSASSKVNESPFSINSQQFYQSDTPTSSHSLNHSNMLNIIPTATTSPNDIVDNSSYTHFNKPGIIDTQQTLHPHTDMSKISFDVDPHFDMSLALDIDLNQSKI